MVPLEQINQHGAQLLALTGGFLIGFALVYAIAARILRHHRDPGPRSEPLSRPERVVTRWEQGQGTTGEIRPLERRTRRETGEGER